MRGELHAFMARLAGPGFNAETEQPLTLHETNAGADLNITRTAARARRGRDWLILRAGSFPAPGDARIFHHTGPANAGHARKAALIRSTLNRKPGIEDHAG